VQQPSKVTLEADLSSDRTTSVSSALLIHRYFAPDTPPYAQMLGAIAGGLSKTRPTVVVAGGVPYRQGTALDAALALEETKDAEVMRVPLLPEGGRGLGRRTLNSLVFAAEAAAKARRHARGAIVMAATTPPVIVALAVAATTKVGGGKFVYHNQDVYPEILGEPGSKLREFGFSILRRLDTWTGRNAIRVVVLSEDMKQLWLARGLPAERVAVIPNFVPKRFHGSVAGGPIHPSDAQLDRGFIRLAYIGNLGPLQDLRRTFELIAVTPGVFCDVYGEGRERRKLEDLNLPNVIFHGQIPSQDVPDVLDDCDLGVVSLVHGVERAAYPSKIMTLLHCGVPILAFIDARSALAQEITDNGIGFVVDDASGHSLEEALRHYDGMSAEDRRSMRIRCLDHGRMFDSNVILDQWNQLFADIDAGLGRAVRQ